MKGRRGNTKENAPFGLEDQGQHLFVFFYS